MFSSIQSTNSAHLALQLAHKFKQLDIEGLPVEDVYPAILEQYAEDILTVADIYENFKKNPDIVRGAPPVAGTSCFLVQYFSQLLSYTLVSFLF